MYLYLFIKPVHMERIHRMKFNRIVSSKDYVPVDSRTMRSPITRICITSHSQPM